MKKLFTSIALIAFVFNSTLVLAFDATAAQNSQGSTNILNGGFNGQGNNAAPAIDPASNGGLGGYSAGGASGGNVGAACTQGIITQAAIFATVMGLSATANVIGVPTGNISSDFGSAFQSASDLQNFLKVNCLDPAARAIYKKMLVQTDQSILNWVNNGFKGGPTNGATFIDNPDSYFSSIKDSAASTWVSDLDETNPFASDIKNAVYQTARVGNQSSYTPDLAEVIQAGACDYYQKQQRTVGGGATNNSLGILGSLGNSLTRLIQGIFGGGSSYPTNNGTFQGTSPSNGNGLQQQIQNAGGLLNLDSLFFTKAYAIAGLPSVKSIFNGTSGTANQNTNSTVYAPTNSGLPGGGTYTTGTTDNTSVLSNGSNDPFMDQRVRDIQNGTASYGNTSSGNPCTRSIKTAAEKQALIDEYYAKQLPVSSSYNWQIALSSLEPQNRKSTAVLNALIDEQSSVGSAVQNEKDILANNNGNTGARECISYIPLSASERATGATKQCRSDGWRITTPGTLLVTQSANVLNTPLENINKLTSNATFADLAQAVLNNLINNLTGQLINNVNGLFSFNSKSGTNSQGSFTQGITNLSQTSTGTGSASDISSSISRTSAYINAVQTNKDTTSAIITTLTSVKTLCQSIGVSQVSPIFGGQIVTGDSRCQIDPYALDYKNDPTAGARLAQNPIYIENQQLDGTKASVEQMATVLTNASNTLSNLRKALSTYQSSQDVNKDATLASTYASLSVSIPTDADINSAQSQKDALLKRLADLQQIETELKVKVAKTTTN